MATYFGKKLKELDGSHKKTPIMTEHDERHDILKHYFFPKKYPFKNIGTLAQKTLC